MKKSEKILLFVPHGYAEASFKNSGFNVICYESNLARENTRELIRLIKDNNIKFIFDINFCGFSKHKEILFFEAAQTPYLYG